MAAPPPILALRAFEAAARLLSFQRAATELGVTPTAISHQIRKLEAHCGAPLFRRRPRPLSLSPAGEALFPAVRDAFQSMADALARLPARAAASLRVTTTNAIAARWLLPRLPAWRRAHPDIALDIAGTDAVLDLRAGEADVAIRYARLPPPDLCTVEILRDSFQVVASPSLVGDARLPLAPKEIIRLPLIEAAWPPSDGQAPTWRCWAAATRAQSGGALPSLAGRVALSFQEEAHAIEAAIGGQGVAICSDALVAAELRAGRLVPICGLRLPGYGFYLTHRANHPRLPLITAFTTWLMQAVVPIT
ncbi:LysR substrate-binding domain-containing protein [Falsiroseomonas sp. E2-1-a4]|uniref:LysR substrate-binding domain-containing protein n=1 Tax=Falsiroseomonas sp. E2-1-a4 TaxID=3239299 RepID=UPI003F31C460